KRGVGHVRLDRRRGLEHRGCQEVAPLTPAPRNRRGDPGEAHFAATTLSSPSSGMISALLSSPSVRCVASATGCPNVGSSWVQVPTHASTHSCQYSAGTPSSFCT